MTPTMNEIIRLLLELNCITQALQNYTNWLTSDLRECKMGDTYSVAFAGLENISEQIEKLENLKYKLDELVKDV